MVVDKYRACLEDLFLPWMFYFGCRISIVYFGRYGRFSLNSTSIPNQSQRRLDRVVLNKCFDLTLE